MFRHITGSGFWDFLKFLLGMLIILIVSVLFLWFATTWYQGLICQYQAKKLGVLYEYDYIGGCYFQVKNKWVSASQLSCCQTRLEQETSK